MKINLENIKKSLTKFEEDNTKLNLLNEEPIRDEDWDDFDEAIEQFRKNPPANFDDLMKTLEEATDRHIKSGLL